MIQKVKVISNGKISINKKVSIFSKIFKIDLDDIRHAFYRMKTCSKSFR